MSKRKKIIKAICLFNDKKLYYRHIAKYVHIYIHMMLFFIDHAHRHFSVYFFPLGYIQNLTSASIYWCVANIFVLESYAFLFLSQNFLCHDNFSYIFDAIHLYTLN